MSAHDGRAAAWIGAWQRLEAAEKLAMKDRTLNRAVMHHLNAQAQVYAMLANAPAEVGYIAGTWLAEQQEARMAAAARRAESLADIAKRNEEGGDEESPAADE